MAGPAHATGDRLIDRVLVATGVDTTTPGVIADADTMAATSSSSIPGWPGDAAPLLGPILWASALVLLLGVGFALVRHRLATATPRSEEPRPEPACGLDPRAPLATAESLAREGRYTEAIHQLLLGALGTVPGTLPRSLTAREASRRVPRGPRRERLEELAVAVERSHFGGHPATVEEWSRCRDSFDRLVAGERGG